MTIEIGKIEALDTLMESQRHLEQAVKLIRLTKQAGYATVSDLINDLKQLDGKEEQIESYAQKYLSSETTTPIKGKLSTKRKRARLSDQDKAEIFEMKAAGKTASVIANHFGCSIQTIYSLTKGMGKKSAGKKAKKKRTKKGTKKKAK